MDKRKIDFEHKKEYYTHFMILISQKLMMQTRNPHKQYLVLKVQRQWYPQSPSNASNGK